MFRPASFLGVPVLLLALAARGLTQESAISATDDYPDPATTAEPADRPQPSEGATAPESTATTGWSGDTGGSQLGTRTHGAASASPRWQPPTVRSLDLGGRPEPLNEC
ncbi:hypothetical protein [Paracoccus beibuensis]|uniref:hypothetical protein n=1 Tax=Paracoccus beibuensis TaxID=547602 RepID=UPI0022402520|nr:hypothetical protein [Paracoccus beibuensis]